MQENILSCSNISIVSLHSPLSPFSLIVYKKEDKCYDDDYIPVEKTEASLIRTSASFETIRIPSHAIFLFLSCCHLVAYSLYILQHTHSLFSLSLLIDHTFACSEIYFGANLL